VRAKLFLSCYEDVELPKGFFEFEIDVKDREDFEQQVKQIVKDLTENGYRDEDFNLIDLEIEGRLSGIDRHLEKDVNYELVEDFLCLFDELTN